MSKKVTSEYSDEEFGKDAKKYGFSEKFDKEFQKGVDYSKEHFRGKLVIAVAGPVNSGKSTLVNAIFGKDLTGISPIPGFTRGVKLYNLDTDKLMFIADTPGLFDVDEKLSKEALKFTVKHADMIFLLWSGPIQHPKDLKEVFKKLTKTKKPLWVLLTKIDTIKEDQRKDAIKHAKELLNADVLPISAKEGIGLDKVREKLGRVEEQKEGILKVKDIREKDRWVDRRLILFASLAAAGIGAIPLPGADIIPLMALQATTLTKIAKVYGHEVTRDEVKSTLMVTLVGNLGRTVFRQLIKLIPLWGDVVAAGIAGAFTYGLLKAGQAYYRSNMSIPIEELMGIYQETSKAWKEGKVSKELLD